MALATYTDLLASVANWINRSDLTANIPDFVTLAEARIARDVRVRAMINYLTTATVGGTEYIAVPTGFLEYENLTLGTTPQRVLTYETPEQMDVRFPLGGGQSRPMVYTIIGDRLYLGPCPDQAYDIVQTYYKKFDALSTTPTNWLLTNHPGVYLWAALCEAAPFMADDSRLPVWEGKYSADVRALQTADDKSLRSGTVMRVRVSV